MDILEIIFGTGKELTSLQMCCRAFVVFFIALFYIRVAGMRTFGKQSAVDIIIGIMLGALLSRAIVGASPFLSTITACALIVVLHRIIALIAVYNEFFGKIVKGEQRILYEKGKVNWKNMKRSSISMNDLMESVRLETNRNSLEDVEEAHIESNGKISIIIRKG